MPVVAKTRPQPPCRSRGPFGQPRASSFARTSATLTLVNDALALVNDALTLARPSMTTAAVALTSADELTPPQSSGSFAVVIDALTSVNASITTVSITDATSITCNVVELVKSGEVQQNQSPYLNSRKKKDQSSLPSGTQPNQLPASHVPCSHFAYGYSIRNTTSASTSTSAYSSNSTPP